MTDTTFDILIYRDGAKQQVVFLELEAGELPGSLSL
jgi:hypothetical protein